MSQEGMGRRDEAALAEDRLENHRRDLRRGDLLLDQEVELPATIFFVAAEARVRGEKRAVRQRSGVAAPVSDSRSRNRQCAGRAAVIPTTERYDTGAARRLAGEAEGPFDGLGAGRRDVSPVSETSKFTFCKTRFYLPRVVSGSFNGKDLSEGTRTRITQHRHSPRRRPVGVEQSLVVFLVRLTAPVVVQRIG